MDGKPSRRRKGDFDTLLYNNDSIRGSPYKKINMGGGRENNVTTPGYAISIRRWVGEPNDLCAVAAAAAARGRHGAFARGRGKRRVLPHGCKHRALVIAARKSAAATTARVALVKHVERVANIDPLVSSTTVDSDGCVFSRGSPFVSTSPPVQLVPSSEYRSAVPVGTQTRFGQKMNFEGPKSDAHQTDRKELLMLTG
jgi:hypothetical protein